MVIKITKIYLILGDGETKKSSTIRALTGIHKHDKWKIETNHGIIDIYVQIQSLQECNADLATFIEDIKEFEYALVPLRVSGTSKQNNGLEYIKTFIENGLEIVQIVLLGIKELPYKLPPNLPKPLPIEDSENIPSNKIAHLIRNQWGWY